MNLVFSRRNGWDVEDAFAGILQILGKLPAVIGENSSGGYVLGAFKGGESIGRCLRVIEQNRRDGVGAYNIRA